MTQTIRVRLMQPAHEMAQEEILKKIVHLSKSIANASFTEDGSELLVDVPEERAENLSERVSDLCKTVQRGLRSLQRKIVYTSPFMETAPFAASGMIDGVHLLGNGQVALEGTSLRLFNYFNRTFEEMGHIWSPAPLLTPTLIPATTLARCDYFRSFPHNVTFATHLREDEDRIEAFRARHQSREELDEEALDDMETPQACLSPAVCYHVYHLFEDRKVPAEGIAYEVCGKCFRYESSNMRDLRRLWDFTMREIVFLGSRERVLSHRERGCEIVARYLEDHRLAGEIRTASDPFFIAPDATAKTYFQLNSETKYEISLLLPDRERLAVGSLNYHTDFFGRAFNVTLDTEGFMHSVCIAFGLERWVYAFLLQHGADAKDWPPMVREAPEFRS